MKAVYILLIVLLLVGCGPSAEQITATAEIAKAQTQTVAPTLTPTATLTLSPTLTPTITPSPTPSIPRVQGRIQLNFIPANDQTIIPQPPYKVSMKLTRDEEEIIVQAAASDGSFIVDLEPGTYKIFTITIQNKSLSPDDFLIFTSLPELTVPSQPCFHAGTISFYMLRLPPGSLEEQTAMAKQITKREIALVKYSESGGILLPALVEISGTGDCPDLPSLPNDYDWRYLPESSIAIPAPSDWFFRSEQSRPNWSYFISKEEIIDGGSFQTGLSIILLADENKGVDEFVNGFPSLVTNQANITNSSEVETWDEGNLAFSEFQVEATGQLFDFTSHYLLVGNRDTNVQYIFIFEGPTDQWDDAWADGKVMMENLQFLDSE